MAKGDLYMDTKGDVLQIVEDRGDQFTYRWVFVGNRKDVNHMRWNGYTSSLKNFTKIPKEIFDIL